MLYSKNLHQFQLKHSLSFGDHKSLSLATPSVLSSICDVPSQMSQKGGGAPSFLEGWQRDTWCYRCPFIGMMNRRGANWKTEELKIRPPPPHNLVSNPLFLYRRYATAPSCGTKHKMGIMTLRNRISRHFLTVETTGRNTYVVEWSKTWEQLYIKS